MITTPKIDRLTRKRDACREEARDIEVELRRLRREERERISAEKAELQSKVSRVKWFNRRLVANETHRLRILLVDAMLKNGAGWPEIEKAIGVSKGQIRMLRLQLERRDRRLAMSGSTSRIPRNP